MTWLTKIEKMIILVPTRRIHRNQLTILDLFDMDNAAKPKANLTSKALLGRFGVFAIEDF